MKHITQATEKRINEMVQSDHKYGEALRALLDEQEVAAMKMYETIPEAISIFHASDPATIHTIHDSITGHTITGTAAEVIPALLTYDAEHDDNTSFGPVDTSNVETWAVIEYAYSL